MALSWSWGGQKAFSLQSSLHRNSFLKFIFQVRLVGITCQYPHASNTGLLFFVCFLPGFVYVHNYFYRGAFCCHNK